MAINVSFNGATIFRPGAYSRSTIDLGGGFPIGPSGLVAVFGEADAGAPGASEINIANNRFTGDQLVSIRNKYRSGPIVDSTNFLFAPASDAAIPSGAQTVWFYKTNASVRATLSLADSYGPGKLAAIEWGTGGNRLTYECVSVSESAPSVAGIAFDESALSGGETLSVVLNGNLVNTFTAIVCADNAAMASAVADAGNWSAGAPVGFVALVGGVDGASTLTITMDADATAHQNGFGRNMELIGTDFGITPALVSASVEPSVTLTLSQKRDLIEEEEALGGNIVLMVGNDGSNSNTAATVTVDASSIKLLEDAVVVKTISKDEYLVLSDVVSEINLLTGWSAALSNTAYNQLSPSVLDQVTALGAFSASGAKPAQIKKDAFEVADFFDLSSLANIGTDSSGKFVQEDPVVGLPSVQSEVSLTGGAKGATTSASIVEALNQFTKFHVNSIVPLFSRDASEDVSDGLTDSGSTYTIDAIHQAVKTHISLMKTTKRRSERQGYLSYKASFEDCKTKAGVLADGRLQLVIQDTRNVDALGNVKWFQPWALGCMFAGARGGSPIGTPLTFKNMNTAGIRHTAQPMSTADADIVIDFDPDLQVEDAIIAGISFLEAPQTGGFRVVVDNTTYGRDGNFVWNRANVIYAADTVAYTLRNVLEVTFVGQKNTLSPSIVSATVESIMLTLLGQGIIVSTPDAPNGFKDLTVSINGNTINVSIVIKVVEGIDFVLADISVQRAVQ